MSNSPSHLGKLLIIDDDYDLRDSLLDYFKNSGYDALAFDNGQDLLDYLPEHFNGVVICDLKMPGMSGLDILEKTRKMLDPPPFILMTAYGDIPIAVKAIQNGAYDFLEKPFNPSQLIDKVQYAAQIRHLQLDNYRLRQQLGELARLDQQILGNTSLMQQLREQVMDYAVMDAPVLITGEAGVGKYRVANLLHMNSQRSQQALVTVNCDIVTEQQLMDSSPDGLFQSATGGTLLLDDIDTLTDSQQARLLHHLNQTSQVLVEQQAVPKMVQDVRIISTATVIPSNQNKQTDKTVLRQDLLFFLNTLMIHVPPLREHKDDILLMFHAFNKRYSNKYNLPVPSLSSSDITMLSAYHWPGNVRELEHCAERFVLANQLRTTGIDEILDMGVAKTGPSRNLRQHVEQFEKTLIQQSLTECRGNISQVCKSLNIPRRTLNEKLLKHELNRLDYVS